MADSKSKSITSKLRFAFISVIMIAVTACVLWLFCFVKIDDRYYSIFTTDTYTVTDSSFKDYSVFNRFLFLKTLDVSQLDLTLSDYDYISSQVNDKVKILWNVPVGCDKVMSDSASLTITDRTGIVDTSFFHYLTDLKTLNINSIEVSPLLKYIIDSARNASPDVTVNCKTSVYGVEFDTTTELLDLNTVKMTDLTDLDIVLSTFPNIKSAEICSCPLENEVIAALRDKYPEKKVVWSIRIPRNVIRTDVQVFSTLSPNKKKEVNSKNAYPLFKYCTELRALDLGHNSLTDISEIANLKHLHTLILADNFITDISPLRELKDLNYVEFQYNKIEDATPLSELPLMEDIKLCHNFRVKNITSITKCKNLKKFFFASCGVRGYQIQEIKQNVPEDCKLSYIEKFSTISFWRKGDKNAAIRQAFANWRTVKEFPDWQNPVYWDKDVYSYWQESSNA